MPVPRLGGGWGRGRLTASEASVWMRELLEECLPDSSTRAGLGTHSCKATRLAWCGRAGLPERVRRLLGYHIKPGDVSMLTYSRDAVAGPLRELGGLLIEVRKGRFLPDASRSGRWLARAVPGATAKRRAGPPRPGGGEASSPLAGPGHLDGPAEGALSSSPDRGPLEGRCAAEAGGGPLEGTPGSREGGPGAPSVASSSSSSSDESSCSESSSGSESAGSDGPERACAALGREGAVRGLRGPAVDRDQRVYRHALRGTFHLGSGADEARLACGRAVSASFARCHTSPSPMWPQCANCFGSGSRANA